MIPEVAHTAELQRILTLPRRVWAPEDASALAGELTSILRTPAGSMTMRNVQAIALHDAGTEGGLFGPVGVGEGKTLATLLLPVVLFSRKPLLLLPGGLIEKTQRERYLLSQHWRIPNTLRVFSYDMLGRVQAEHELDDYAPDAIICDEAHRLKNKGAAVTRRVARYMHARPTTKFCALSGSIMDKSIKEFAHILLWCLKTKAPIPTAPEEIDEWAMALDECVDPMARTRPGALLEFATAAERAELGDVVAARRGFQRRLTETPGVVATVGDGEHVGASIYLRGIQHKVSAQVEAAFDKLRNEMRTPDEWKLDSGADVWRHAQELALGLYYAWDPRPPDDWREARRDWHSFVTNTISRSRTYDSELHVANAIDAGKLPLGVGVLARWRSLRPTFEPNVVARWVDDSALHQVTKWCEDTGKDGGIIWTEHRLFAERLAKHAGIPYYGAKGIDARTGRNIIDERPGSVVIASIDANREGKNLQEIWFRNLLVCPPRSSAWCEQLIARTHRPGQKADTVFVDVLLGCRENYDNIVAAIVDAQATQDLTGKRQKLLLADVTLPSEAKINAIGTPRWDRTLGVNADEIYDEIFAASPQDI